MANFLEFTAWNFWPQIKQFQDTGLKIKVFEIAQFFAKFEDQSPLSDQSVILPKYCQTVWAIFCKVLLDNETLVWGEEGNKRITILYFWKWKKSIETKTKFFPLFFFQIKTLWLNSGCIEASKDLSLFLLTLYSKREK